MIYSQRSVLSRYLMVTYYRLCAAKCSHNNVYYIEAHLNGNFQHLSVSSLLSKVTVDNAREDKPAAPALITVNRSRTNEYAATKL